ncbi:MAG: hypothetical protein M1832_000579 [Thelocarpon impressellum]|nr:MAG: hypothetical protein M1832_000579 [Thelocarpon impressellum]
MVSLWPWKGDDASPASFERTLSTLSTKITTNTARLDLLRQRLRRFKALWTLYASFVYILYSLILALVVGWRDWGAVEYAAVAGGPVVIYLVRLVLATYYNYRLSSVTQRLGELEKERGVTIDKLKLATKYNSTQQLLEKYGGSSTQSSPAASPAGTQRRRSGAGQRSPGTPKGIQRRVGIAPPATANIPRNVPSLPSTPQSGGAEFRSPLSRQVYPSHVDPPVSTAPHQAGTPQPGPPEFAPNAFSAPPQFSTGTDAGKPHWYDRVLDLLLGEDETQPKNRVVLICQHCRLVNGQAPPGVKDVEEVGKWRCAGCGGWNGEDSKARKLVDEITEQVRGEGDGRRTGEGDPEEAGDSEEDAVLVPTSRDVSEAEIEDQAADDDEARDKQPAKPRRGRSKGSGKKKAMD